MYLLALSRGLFVITHNTGEFSRVPDLKIEDWMNGYQRI